MWQNDLLYKCFYHEEQFRILLKYVTKALTSLSLFEAEMDGKGTREIGWKETAEGIQEGKRDDKE
jgi:hypothetical protein